MKKVKASDIRTISELTDSELATMVSKATKEIERREVQKRDAKFLRDRSIQAGRDLHTAIGRAISRSVADGAGPLFKASLRGREILSQDSIIAKDVFIFDLLLHSKELWRLTLQRGTGLRCGSCNYDDTAEKSVQWREEGDCGPYCDACWSHVAATRKLLKQGKIRPAQDG